MYFTQRNVTAQKQAALAGKNQQPEAPRSALVTQGKQSNNTSLFSILSGWLLVYQQWSVLIF